MRELLESSSVNAHAIESIARRRANDVARRSFSVGGEHGRGVRTRGGSIVNPIEHKPNLEWRRIVKASLRAYHPEPGRDPEEDFRVYIERSYQFEKGRLALLANRSSTDRACAERAVYRLAVALLTYGRLEMVEDIVKLLPGDRDPSRMLARSLHALLPLGADLDVYTTRAAAVLDWLAQNTRRLRWNETAGRFELAFAS
jgi:hypothetical protein